MKTPFAFSFFLFNFFFLISFSQVWYFGNGAGLNFSRTGVQPLHDGKIYTNEGCSAAHDEKRNLLFYSDGITVWDKNHSAFKNGEGLNGNKSSTQSSLIIPKPESKNLFYIFTVDTSAGTKGICYSLADVSANVVISKNQKLVDPATEKLAAVCHSNGKDAWLITHAWNSNNFYSYPVTEKGIGAPVISSVGIIHKETGSGKNRETIGEMKFSRDGKKIAVAVCYRSANNLDILDFDNSTGKISNPISLSVNGYPYGLCFSPDNTKLYVSFLKGPYGIVQYDLSYGKGMAMTPSPVTINENPNTFGSLQLGPDGKIYAARNGCCLDAIYLPDNKGAACDYREDAVKLLPSGSTFGLPNIYVNSSKKIPPVLPLEKKSLVDCSKIIEKPFSNKDKLLMTEISVCENEYILNAKNFGASFNWSTLQTTQKISVDTTGLYRVSVSKDGCMLTDSVKVRFRKDMSVFRYLPAFNPESGFLNSEFYYDIDDVQEFELKVFDGKQKKVIFETRNTGKKWNGKNSKGEIVSAGEYFWSVKYKPNCPKESNTVTQEGKVTVNRKK